MPKLPAKIRRAPRAFKDPIDAINQLADALRVWERAKGERGIKVSVTDNNIVVTLEGGGLLPAGAVYQQVTLTLAGGGTVTRWVPTWTNNPS